MWWHCLLIWFEDEFCVCLYFTREIHNLDPQPHRHCMLAPRPSPPQVTRCSLGKYWSRDFFQKEAESSRQGVGNPEPYLFSLPLSRSDRLPRRWGQQAASLGYTGYLWLIVGGSEIWWCMHSAHSLSTTPRFHSLSWEGFHRWNYLICNSILVCHRMIVSEKSECINSSIWQFKYFHFANFLSGFLIRMIL